MSLGPGQVPGRQCVFNVSMKRPLAAPAVVLLFVAVVAPLASVYANGVDFPATSSCVSPDFRWRVTCESKGQPDGGFEHCLFLRSLTGTQAVPLYVTGRWCELLWNNGRDAVAITDWEGSNISSVFIVDLHHPEDRRDLLDIVPGLPSCLLKVEAEGHIYWEALKWESVSGLLVRVFGHTDEAGGHEFAYVFLVDLAGGTYTLIRKDNAPDSRAEEEAWKSKADTHPSENLLSDSEKKSGLWSLEAADAFPREFQQAQPAIIAAIEREGLKPSEYFVEPEPHRTGAVWEFSLWHRTALSQRRNPQIRGDPTGKCRTVAYDPATKSVTQIYGWR